MGIKALFTYDYGTENMNKIRELGYDVKIIGERGIQFSEELKDIEVLVCYNPFETLDISKMTNLKWIQLSSTGVDQIPKEKAVDLGVKVTNNKGGYSIPIGEWIVLSILELFKNSKKLFKQQQEKRWKIDTSVLEVYGKTIGFIGTGTLAKEGAKRLQGFGVKILGLNTNGRKEENFDFCYPSNEINKFLGMCDVIVVTIPYTKKTNKFIDNEKFKAMKDRVYFINVARGNVVDQDALIENLRSRKIKAAALDVFEEEPLGENSPLWNMDNVIITPHNCWVSENRNERRFVGILENMKRYKNKTELINIIDIKEGY